ncbi:indora [Wolbachia endosymbiont of Drosophila ananassae]|nr:indora [Wolbachia endosymbiont of Drosophila ananassae]
MINHAEDYRLLNKLSLLEESPTMDRQEKLLLLRQEIQTNSRKAYEQNVKQYNMRSKLVSFKEGQEVFKRNFQLSNFSQNYNKKLGPLFSKCRVKKKLGNAYYLLETLSGKELGTYHAKDIKC